MEKKKSKSSLELIGSHRFYISQKCFNVNIVASSNNFLVILFFGSFKTTYVKKFSYSLKLLIEDKGSIFLLVCLSLPRSPEGTLLNLANDERTQIVQVTSFQMRGRDLYFSVSSFLRLFSNFILGFIPPPGVVRIFLKTNCIIHTCISSFCSSAIFVLCSWLSAQSSLHVFPLLVPHEL